MKTLLVIYPGSDVMHNSSFHLIHAETGEVLASHFCSCSGFAPGDLYFNRPERIEEFTKRFGEVEVKFIDETTIDKEELLSRNKAFYKEQEAQGG